VSSVTLWRLAGLSALLGGVLFVAFDILGFFEPEAGSDLDVVAHGILALSSGLALVGLIGLYGIQARESGVMGLVGFLASFVGALLGFGFAWGGVVIVPEIVDTPFIQNGPERSLAAGLIWIRLPLTALGFLVLAAATLRAGVLSRTGAWIMLAGAFLGALNTLFISLPGPLRGPALGGLGFAWLGYSVIRVAGRRRRGELRR
jgi:hypothetical protein